MKKYIIILTLLITNTVWAQKENNMTKPISGRYTQGSQSAIFVYDDGTFALFGYATLVLGKYTINDNVIAFTPEIPEQAFNIVG